MAISKQASLLATETRAMKSKVNGKLYRISIALPYGYDNSINIFPFDHPLSTWPVVYLPDGDFFFGMVTDMVRMMARCGRTSEAIIVGIGYPDQESIRETWRQEVASRTHDLTPMQSDKSEKFNSDWLKLEVKTGGGGNFLKFIQQELIPTIEREYHADPAKRILIGHSHGGLFALFAMLEAPELFNSYIASSPSLNFSARAMFSLETEYAKKHESLPAQLFLSAGGLEEDADTTDLTDMYRFAALLESRKYKDFSLKKQVFPDCDHCEVVAPAFQAGLKMALRK